MSKKAQKLEKKLTTTRSFSYSKSDISLNFNLKIDAPGELEKFRECLLEAVKDIDELLAKFK